MNKTNDIATNNYTKIKIKTFNRRKIENLMVPIYYC